MQLVKNPILPGTYPDPSICRVGDDYYLVTSTFEYLPGLPVFHSRDLANWTQIGHVIDREGMLRYTDIGSSGGLYAPTIRHDDVTGKYFVVCTLVDRDMNIDAGAPAGNFIVMADNPAGPWSDPIWLDKPGIDPSLFFDTDGKVWLHGTRLADPGEWFHQTEVWLQELDRKTWKPIGEEYILWNGAVRGAVWTEGPHIYFHNGYYYLLMAEGGTERHHAITVARAKTITGPYEGNKGNPIFTHRHLGHMYPVMGVGHSDLTQGPDNTWWAVLLAMRLYGGYHYNLGRETFLVPVTWEEDWPVFAAGEGKVPDTVTVPGVAVSGTEPGTPGTAHGVAGLVLPGDLRWSAPRALPTSLATPTGNGWRLPMRSTTLADTQASSFIGIRQQHFKCDLDVTVNIAELRQGEWAGLAIRQSEKDFATFMISPTGKPGEYHLEIVLSEKGETRVIAERPLTISGNTVSENAVKLGLRIREQDYRCVFISNDGAEQTVGTINGRTLDTASAGGFIGLWLGIYATSNGQPAKGQVTATLSYFPR
ncbi:MAG: glycoside hydrolase family 43 protein [Promicromonosporaceae bacterium]|nr:glycoside hydrolase family 43 protein [Promicromonosporaceae bacterium]